ncbi:MAG TPA: hypothetical protein VFG60_00345, partial [Burkholderiaceae bacterium]|nr:hypothetical protein [Burkholderiaceae bacterium]
HISAAGDGGCNISIERKLQAGEDLVLLRRGIIAPTLPCVSAAARANGADLSFDSAQSRFALRFASAVSGRSSERAGAP